MRVSYLFVEPPQASPAKPVSYKLTVAVSGEFCQIYRSQTWKYFNPERQREEYQDNLLTYLFLRQQRVSKQKHGHVFRRVLNKPGVHQILQPGFGVEVELFDAVQQFSEK